MTLKHSSDEGALLFTFSSKRRLEENASPSRSVLLRVWLPSRGCIKAYLHPWEHLSAPGALGFNPTKLFSFQRIEAKFPLLLSDLALSSKTEFGFRSALHRFHPRRKAVLLLRPEGLGQGEGVAFLGLRTSQVLPLDSTGVWLLPPQAPPLHPVRSLTPREASSPQAQGCKSNQVQHLPISRTLTCLAFLPVISCHLFMESRSRGLFFPLEHPGSFTASFARSLCEPLPHS